MVEAPQFLQTAKDFTDKAWWLLRWLRPERVLCFFGTPMIVFPYRFPLSNSWRGVRGEVKKPILDPTTKLDRRVENI